LVVQKGVTDAAVVEIRLTAADGDTFDADLRSLQGEGHLGRDKLMHSWGFALREGVFAETK